MKIFSDIDQRSARKLVEYIFLWPNWCHILPPKVYNQNFTNLLYESSRNNWLLLGEYVFLSLNQSHILTPNFYQSYKWILSEWLNIISYVSIDLIFYHWNATNLTYESYRCNCEHILVRVFRLYNDFLRAPSLWLAWKLTCHMIVYERCPFLFPFDFHKVDMLIW